MSRMFPHVPLHLQEYTLMVISSAMQGAVILNTLNSQIQVITTMQDNEIGASAINAYVEQVANLVTSNLVADETANFTMAGRFGNSVKAELEHLILERRMKLEYSFCLELPEFNMISGNLVNSMMTETCRFRAFSELVRDNNTPDSEVLVFNRFDHLIAVADNVFLPFKQDAEGEYYAELMQTSDMFRSSLQASIVDYMLHTATRAFPKVKPKTVYNEPLPKFALGKVNRVSGPTMELVLLRQGFLKAAQSTSPHKSEFVSYITRYFATIPKLNNTGCSSITHFKAMYPMLTGHEKLMAECDELLKAIGELLPEQAEFFKPIKTAPDKVALPKQMIFNPQLKDLTPSHFGLPCVLKSMASKVFKAHKTPNAMHVHRAHASVARAHINLSLAQLYLYICTLPFFRI